MSVLLYKILQQQFFKTGKKRGLHSNKRSYSGVEKAVGLLRAAKIGLLPEKGLGSAGNVKSLPFGTACRLQFPYIWMPKRLVQFNETGTQPEMKQCRFKRRMSEGGQFA